MLKSLYQADKIPVIMGRGRNQDTEFYIARGYDYEKY